MKLQELIETFKNDEIMKSDTDSSLHQKITWIDQMMQEYAKQLHLDVDTVAEIIEAKRTQPWYEYYTQIKFPGITQNNIYGVFKDGTDYVNYTSEHYIGYRCPKCGEISSSPVLCHHVVQHDGLCDATAHQPEYSSKGVVIVDSGLHLIPTFEPVLKSKPYC